MEVDTERKKKKKKKKEWMITNAIAITKMP